MGISFLDTCITLGYGGVETDVWLCVFDSNFLNFIASSLCRRRVALALGFLLGVVVMEAARACSFLIFLIVALACRLFEHVAFLSSFLLYVPL